MRKLMFDGFIDFNYFPLFKENIEGDYENIYLWNFKRINYLKVMQIIIDLVLSE
jgi:hypothetical protein